MRRIRVIIAASVVILLVVFACWKLSNSRSFQLFGEIVPRVATQEMTVALTFDDGPTPLATGEVLSILRHRQVKATFFVTGAELEQHLELGKEIVKEGHELGNHSYSHHRMVLKTPSFISDEIERTDRLIRSAGYEGPIHFRPPYSKKLVFLPYYLSKTNRKTIMCDIEPDSYPEVAADADKIVEYVANRVRPGSIILLHVMYKSREQSLRAVGGIIDRLQGEGYQFRTVAELLSSK